METLDDIEALLSAAKSVVAGARWTESRPTTLRLKGAVEIGGEIRGRLFLHGDATLHTRVQRGSLVLVYCDRPIERISIFPASAHVNPLDRKIPKPLRGLTLTLGISPAPSLGPESSLASRQR